MSEWSTVRLEEIATIHMGQSPPGSSYNTDGVGLPFLQGSAEFGLHVPIPVKWCSQPLRVAEVGDLMLSVRAPVGDTNFATTSTAIGRGLAIIKAPSSNTTEFLRLSLQFSKSALLARSGVGMFSSITGKELRGFELALPPLLEQRRIVAVMSAVDAQIEALNAEMAAASRALDLVRNELPVADLVPLGEVLVGIDSGKSIQTAGEAAQIGSPRILKVSAIRPGLFRPDEAKTVDVAMPPASLVNEGDLLMTRSNTPDRVGYCARARLVPVDTYMPDLIWRLRVDKLRIDADYTEQALASPVMRNRVTATATGTSASMRKINKRGVSTVLIPLPVLEVQRRFAASCHSASVVLNALASELASLCVVRAGLLTAVLSQEVTVDGAVDEFMRAA